VAKKFQYGDKGRLSLLAGVNLLADAVRVTLGPHGRNVLIQHRTDGVMPIFTRDGVTVARAIGAGDNAQDIGVAMLRQMAARVSAEAGDGTSTAIVLARRIAAEAVKAMNAGMDPKSLRHGMEIAVRAAVAELRKHARACLDQRSLASIGAMASNGEEGIGEMLARAIEEVGPDGVVSIELGESLADEIEFVEGAEWEQGYASPYFITDKTHATAELDNPYVLLYDRVIHRFEELIPVLDKVKRAKGSLLIVAENIEEGALPGLLLNHIRRVLKAVVVKPPAYGDHRKDALGDLAALLGGRAILESCGDDLSRVQLDDLGRAKRAVVKEDRTALIGGAGERKAIEERLASLRQQLDWIRQGVSGTNSAVGRAHDREGMEERIRRLGGKAAVIRVGGGSDLAIKERMQRFENALNSIRGAMREGVLPGGGTGLLRARAALDQIPRETLDVACGVDIIRKAITEPARLIIGNAGEEPGHVIARILASGDEFWGFDARRGVLGDLYELGVLDPLRVTRLALEEAAVTAATLMTTECVITQIPPEDPLYGYTPEWAAATRENPRV